MAPVPTVYPDGIGDESGPEVVATGNNCRSKEPERQKNSCSRRLSVEAPGSRSAKPQTGSSSNGNAALDRIAGKFCHPKTVRNVDAEGYRRSSELALMDRQPITYRLLTAILCFLLMPMLLIWFWPSKRPVDMVIRETAAVPDTNMLRMDSDDRTGTPGAAVVPDNEPVMAARDTGRKNDDADLVSVPEAEEQTVPEAAPVFKIETGSFRLTIERPDNKSGRIGSANPGAESSKLEQTYSPFGVNRQTVTHIVVRGDTLWDIARTYMGDPFRYPELAKLSRIRDPDWIYPGDVVRIIRKSTD